MSNRVFDDWLKAYIDYTRHSEAPTSFHFWAGVATIAGALRRRVWLDMGHFQWTPNFYIVFVAPPGVISKSTTMGIGMKLLREIPGVKFGPDVVTWQALVESLAESTESVLINKEFHPMSCLTIASSEFGTFLDPRDRDMVDTLVSLWDGQVGVWEKQTKTQGSDKIENPWVNIVACTTPAWIEGNFPDYMIGGGFTSRCVWVYGDKKRQLIAYPGLHMPKQDMEEFKGKLIHDLKRIANLSGPFKLSSSAIQFGEDWYSRHYETNHKHLNGNQFGGYLARKQTHIHKLAMILSAAESNSLVLERHHLEKADAYVTALENDMPKVFENISSDPEIRAAVNLEHVVSQHKEISRTALYRLVFRQMGYEAFEKALVSGAKAGKFKLLQKQDDFYVQAITPVVSPSE